MNFCLPTQVRGQKQLQTTDRPQVQRVAERMRNERFGQLKPRR